MGKYTVLAVLAVVLGTTLLGRQGMRTDQETSESQAEHQKEVLAREIARSAFEMGASELRRDFENWRVQRTKVEYEGGRFDLIASGDPSGPVALKAVGYFGDAAYEMTGEVNQETTLSSAFNAITASIPITFDVSGGGCSGGPCVSGIDAGGRQDRHGITLPPNANPDDVCEEFGEDKVEGKAGGCDVIARTEERDEWVTQKMEKLRSEVQNAIDAGSEDVKQCDGCRAEDFEDNSGILYVTGEFTINGSRQWNGLVLVGEGGSVRFNGGGSTRNINGGLVLDDNTAYEQDEEFDMNGGNAVKFNSDELVKYLNTLPSLSQTTVQVTDRTGRLLSSSE